MPPDTAPTVHPWLAQFPTASRSYVVAWFGYAASQGAKTPEAVLEIVARVCSRKLEWSMSRSTAQLCQGVLLALTHGRPGARAYAQTVLGQVPDTTTGAKATPAGGAR